MSGSFVGTIFRICSGVIRSGCGAIECGETSFLDISSSLGVFVCGFELGLFTNLSSLASSIMSKTLISSVFAANKFSASRAIKSVRFTKLALLTSSCHHLCLKFSRKRVQGEA